MEVRDRQTSLGQSIERMKKLLDRLGENEGWFLLFDPEHVNESDKCTCSTETAPDGKLIHVIIC